MSTDALMPNSISELGRIERIRFEAIPAKDATVLYRIPSVEGWTAIEVPGHQQPADLELLIHETPSIASSSTWLERAATWTDEGNLAQGKKSTLISLHGVEVLWNDGRAAATAPRDRIDSVRKAILDFAIAERELRLTEETLNLSWKQLENDIPTAFAYSEEKVRDRAALGKRFQQIIELRGRLSRVIPLIVQPSQYPPTLQSQTLERLRERMRQEDRVEVVERQLDIFNNVYEMCSQRSSDFMLARSGHILEWIIILLLALQTILSVVDYLPATGT